MKIGILLKGDVMPVVLNHKEIRVLGALMEKEVTTPDYYPMSLNGLQNACNQKSNRDPVMHLDEHEVHTILDALREKRLAWQRSVSGARVMKYEHNIKSLYPLSEQEFGVMCILFLRGPQTVGEIRQRTERLCPFASLPEVEEVVRGLISRDDGPFVVELPRQIGRKEPRFVHLFAGQEWVDELIEAAALEQESSSKFVQSSKESYSARVEELESTVSRLQEELSELKKEFHAFRSQLE
jgi:uncharacterized protein